MRVDRRLWQASWCSSGRSNRVPPAGTAAMRAATAAELFRWTDYLESLEEFLDKTPEFGDMFPVRKLTYR